MTECKSVTEFNVHVSCFVDFVPYPTDKCMFKVINKKIRLCMCSSLEINTAWLHSIVFTVDFGHSQHISIVFLLLTLNKYLPVRCERRVIMFWKPYFKACFIEQFISAPNWNNVRPHCVFIMIWTCYGHMFPL